MLAIAGQAPDTGKMADGDEVDGLAASTAATDAAGAKTGAAPATGAVPWNPRSFVSAKAALMETETAAGGRLDEAVLMADPPAMKASLNEASPRDVEDMINAWVSGWVHLLRETVSRMAGHGGSIILIVRHTDRGPLGAMAASAIFGLAEGMLQASASGVRFTAIRDESDNPDALARHVLRLLDEPQKDTGKLLKFTGKTGLFGRG